MKKRWYVLLATVLLVVSLAVLIVCGRSYDLQVDVSAMTDYRVQIDQNHEIVRITDQHEENGVLYMTVEGVSEGHVYIDVLGANDLMATCPMFVHRFGVVTEEEFLGRSTGGAVIPISLSVFLAALLFGLIRQYRADVRRNLYQYKNVKTLGLILYLIPLLISQILGSFHYRGVARAARTLLDGASSVASYALPAAFVLSILVTLSNLRLMRREGRTWKNMLGCILGMLLCLSTIFPSLLGEYLQRATFVDVHNEQGWALYTELAVESAVLVLVSYLESILMSTVILAVKAARHIPAFDKDYILILGCQIKKDGTLTNLLKGRADRAIDFARMQKDAAGRDIVFVPSGGKGADEVISEAEAIRNYLLGTGVDGAQILPETESASTFENLRNSASLIRARSGDAPRIAFSTTNYHVFRAGILAAQQGIDAEGIGSPTRSYFWINAFIREFIATLVTERRTHVAIVAALILNTVAMAATAYLSAIL